MQKIIKGRKYDTDTAQEVCGYSNGLPFGDFDWVQETLFIKRTGEYFLYGKGGARSKYAVPDGDFMGGGSEIIPLSDEDAKAFVEENGDVETYEKYFGETSEGDTTKTNITLSASAKKKLQRIALEKRISISQVIERLIENA